MGDQPTQDIESIALAHAGRQVRPVEGDAIEHIKSLAQRQLGMSSGRCPHAGDRQALDRNQRIGVARAGRRQPGELRQERVVHLGAGHDQVDQQLRAWIRGRRHARSDEREEPGAECVPMLHRDLEAGRPGMAAMPNEQIGGLGQTGRQIEPARTPTRCADEAIEFRADNGGSPALLGQPPGHQPDDPDRPVAADDRGCRIAGLGGECRLRLGHR